MSSKVGSDERIDSILSVAGRLGDDATKAISVLYRSAVMEILVGLFAGALYFGNAIRYAFPTGYAGLYSLIIEEIIAHNFQFPVTIPYYGPGGIPFAYPPLAFYVASVFVGLFHVPIFVYIRFAPAVFALFSLGILYVLCRTILASRSKALLATLLFATTNSGYLPHITAAGVVRGLALVPMLAGLVFGWKAIRSGQPSRGMVALSALCFALTAATHLSYPIVFVFGITAFLIIPNRHPYATRLIPWIAILIGGIFLASPWWLGVLLHHGPDVFLSAYNSHGTLGILFSKLTNPIGFLFSLAQPLLESGYGWIPTPMFGLILLGLGYSLLKKELLLPVWFFLVLDFSGGDDRFLVIIGAMMAADLLIDAMSWRVQPTATNRGVRLWSTVTLLIIVGVCVGQAVTMARRVKPVLSQGIIDAGRWFETSTPADATYVFITENHDLAEWLPYLTRRTPQIGYWGAEWTGRFGSGYDLFWRLANCAVLQSYSCANDIFREMGRTPDYLIVQSRNQVLVNAILTTNVWHQVRSDGNLAIFQYAKEQ